MNTQIHKKGARGPSHEEIAALAYELWEKGGRQPGSELENWLKAEKQLSVARAVTIRHGRNGQRAQTCSPEPAAVSRTSQKAQAIPKRAERARPWFI